MTTNAKLLYHGYYLHSTLLGEPLPAVLSFESTNHCNLSCSHCGHSQYPQFEKGYLDEALFDKVSKLLGPNKIPAVNLSDFGEPFMSKGWWGLFEKARSIPELRIGFITNALLVDRHLDKLTHPNLDISISMDGASENTYSHFRGQGHFDKVVANLELLHEQERLGILPKSNRSFIVVLSRVNVQEMTAIIELAARLGVSTVIFSFQVFFDDSSFREQSLFFARELYDANLGASVIRAAELGIMLVYPNAFDGSTRIPDESMPRLWLWRDAAGRTQCGSIRNNCYIKFHGQIEACCVPDRYPLGDLNVDGFLDIWHGPYYRRLRQSFVTGEWLPTCQNCNLFQSVDVEIKQSHFLKPVRDDGRLVSMQQPYRITELDIRYRELLTEMQTDSLKIRAQVELRDILTVDEHLHEVSNALGVMWIVRGEAEKGLRILELARKHSPSDLFIAHNYELAQKTFLSNN